jgi:hypothetical protein
VIAADGVVVQHHFERVETADAQKVSGLERLSFNRSVQAA